MTDSRWATTSDIEASCGVSNGIWFSYAADIDMVVTLITGTGGWFGQMIDGEVVNCSGGNSQYFTAPAGKTSYFFTGPTGELGMFDFWARVQPLSHITLDVNAKATVNKTGEVTITGTGFNTPEGDTVVTVIARQRSGHGYISAVAGPWAVSMTPGGMPLSFTMAPDRGKSWQGRSRFTSMRSTWPAILSAQRRSIRP